ncbi:aspartic peptidase domain-containing protein, partial [Mycena amicta]
NPAIQLTAPIDRQDIKRWHTGGILSTVHFLLPPFSILQVAPMPGCWRAHATFSRSMLLSLFLLWFWTANAIPSASSSTRLLQPRADTVVHLPLTFITPTNFYHLPLSIGTPPQTFAMLLDIGISDMVVAGNRCGGSSTGCPIASVSTYDFAASTTMVNKSTALTTIPFGEGSTTGYIVADTVTMAGISIPGISFLESEDITDGPPQRRVAGVIGLGGAQRSLIGIIPFWQSILLLNQLAEAQFSFWLGRITGDPLADADQPAGTFVFGGVNESLYTGDVEFLPSAGRVALAMTINGHGVDFSSSSPVAAIDTNYYRIQGPPDIVSTIWAQVPGVFTPNNDGYYAIPCNLTGNVSVNVSFGGRTWSINPVDMNLGPLGDDPANCRVSIFGLPPPSNKSLGWIFGVPFLRNVYSVFKLNPAEIGFAELSEIAGGSSQPQTSTSSATPTDTTGTPSRTPSPSPHPRSQIKAGIVAGLIIGAIIVLGLSLGVTFYVRRRRRRREPQDPLDPDSDSDGSSITPFIPHLSVSAATTSLPHRKTPPAPMNPFARLKQEQSDVLWGLKRMQQTSSAENVRDRTVRTSRGFALMVDNTESERGTAESSEATPPLIIDTHVPTIPVVRRELATLREQVRRLEAVEADLNPPLTYLMSSRSQLGSSS